MEKNTFMRSSLNSGLIVGLVVSAYLLLKEIIGFSGTGTGFLTPLLFLIGLVMTGKQFEKSAPDADFSYSRAFGFGALASLVAGVVYALLSYIYYNYFSAEGVMPIIIQFENNMLRADMSSQEMEQLENFSDIMRQYLTPTTLALGRFFNIAFLGLFLSLISAIFTQRKQQNPFDRDMKKIDDD